MVVCRAIDSELSQAFGRNTMLRLNAQDNIAFILCHPELADKMDLWQERFEEYYAEMEALKNILETSYLEGIDYLRYVVVSANELVVVTLRDDSVPNLAPEWRTVEDE